MKEVIYQGYTFLETEEEEPVNLNLLKHLESSKKLIKGHVLNRGRLNPLIAYENSSSTYVIGRSTELGEEDTDNNGLYPIIRKKAEEQSEF
jgi:hypothetical protein